MISIESGIAAHVMRAAPEAVGSTARTTARYLRGFESANNTHGLNLTCP